MITLAGVLEHGTMRKSDPRPPEPPVAKTLEDLRPLLVGPEQTRIQNLEDRLDRGLGEMVAGVLPEAVAASRKKGDALLWAFEPILEKSIHEIVRRDPRSFAEAIAPAMGPAIRAAVASAIRAMIQRLNEALDHSLTLRWRIEAYRTGRPFAEIVLLRTLVYRVEQIFLIHRDTGLVLQHVVAAGVRSLDPDQIAAMFSAIEAFTHEAFREDARLERFRVGELEAWVEHGPLALLVAIVRGIAPESYEETLRQALERMHLEYGDALTSFQGNGAAFEPTREFLSDCLHERRKPLRRWVTPTRAAVVLLALVASLSGLWVSAARRAEARLESYVDALQREPGFVVTNAERSGATYAIMGLRDPLSDDPSSVLTRNGLAPESATLQFAPFYSLDSRVVERRVVQVLRPPPGVTLEFQNGIVEARGIAPDSWIASAQSAAVLLPGVSAFEHARLYSRESVARAQAMAEALEGTELLYSRGSHGLSAGQRALLDVAATRAKALLELGPQIGMKARIVIVGYTGPTGSEGCNDEIGLARARHVVAELQAHGIDSSALEARSGGVRTAVLAPPYRPPGDTEACPPGEDNPRARSATFHVEMRPATEE